MAGLCPGKSQSLAMKLPICLMSGGNMAGLWLPHFARSGLSGNETFVMSGGLVSSGNMAGLWLPHFA